MPDAMVLAGVPLMMLGMTMLAAVLLLPLFATVLAGARWGHLLMAQTADVPGGSGAAVSVSRGLQPPGARGGDQAAP